jgi:ATP-dependent DNA helicase RecG
MNAETHRINTEIANLPVTRIEGIGPKRAELLANLGIETVRDLLLHVPRGWQDRRAIRPVASLLKGEVATVEVEVAGARLVRLRGRANLAVVDLRDGSGAVKATFFGRGFLAKSFVPGTRGIFTGVVGEYKGPCLKNPDYEILSGDEEDRVHTGRIVPIYRLTEGITQRMLRRWIFDALQQYADAVSDELPEELQKEKGFPPIGRAIREVHFPSSIELANDARRRFIYEELFALQLGVLRERATRLHEKKGHAHCVDGPLLRAFRASLPFKLTGGQARAVADILGDMAAPRPMCRLLQGDVGCGKTAVSICAIMAALDGGHQAAIMAPTEVLAEQHFRTIGGALAPMGVLVALMTRSTERAPAMKSAIERGEAQVVIGTHAIIQESISFRNLGLVIVDEQHRFGVLQRSALSEKGLHSDVMHMTATPIPRTLALTVYGAMDISVIDELPPGRTPVKTRRIGKSKLPGLYDFIREQAGKGFQTYIVCPLVEESEKKALTAVTKHFADLSSNALSGLRTELLHGRMPGEEKDALLQSFKHGGIDVLFSTSVIEVGIDVASATTMVIEDAAQFGLTQLHQLRGRVGRGAAESWCFLLGEPKTDDGGRRLKAMCELSSGFDIAEVDLELRGPGEVFGLRQAGMSDLRIADLIRDARIIDEARRDAQRVLDENIAVKALGNASFAGTASPVRA